MYHEQKKTNPYTVFMNSFWQRIFFAFDEFISFHCVTQFVYPLQSFVNHATTTVRQFVVWCGIYAKTSMTKRVGKLFF